MAIITINNGQLALDPSCITALVLADSPTMTHLHVRLRGQLSAVSAAYGQTNGGREAADADHQKLMSAWEQAQRTPTPADPTA